MDSEGRTIVRLENDAFILLRKVEDMIQYGYICVRRFPKSEKFALAVEMKRCMYTILRLNITANKHYYKKTTVRDMDVELAILKHLVRLAHDLKFLPHAQCKNWQTMNIEIGRMIGGWLKAAHAS